MFCQPPRSFGCRATCSALSCFAASACHCPQLPAPAAAGAPQMLWGTMSLLARRLVCCGQGLSPWSGRSRASAAKRGGWPCTSAYLSRCPMPGASRSWLSSALPVWHGAQGCGRAAVVAPRVLAQMGLDEGGMAHRSAQNNQAAPLRRKRPGANPQVGPARPLQCMDASWLLASRIPDARLAEVHLYARMLLQSHSGNVGNRVYPFWLTHSVDVIEVSEDGLSGEQCGGSRHQRRMLPELVESWHQRVSLFAPLRLGDVVRHARSVIPEVRAVLRVEEAGEGEQRGERSVTREAPQHTCPVDVVIRPDTVNADHRRARIPFTQGADGSGSSLRSGPSPEGELEGPASCVEGGGKLLRQRPGHESAEGVPSPGRGLDRSACTAPPCGPGEAPGRWCLVSGTSPSASLCAAWWSSCMSSSVSKSKRRCSLVQPDGPGPALRRTLLTKAPHDSRTGSLGWCWRTASGTGTCGTCGLRAGSRSSCSVSSLPGASGSAVSARAAAESSPK